MSSRILRGRRKADSVRPNPFISISKAVASNASGAGRQAAVIAAASGLVLTGSIAAHAAEAPVQRDSSPATVAETVSADAPTQVVTALATATVNFERPAVASVAAPVIEKPAPVAPAPVAKKAAVTTAAAKAPVAKAAAAAPAAAAPAPAAAAAPAVGGVNAAMVASAYAQIGIMQDCTAMVERALGSAGIPVGDLGPMQFMNYGKVVS